MKSKILTLIIGILIGAIIATTGFLIYTKVNEKSNVNNRQMMMKGNGEMPQMPQDMENGGDNVNTKKGRKQVEGNENAQTQNANSLANTENSEPPEMPNGEMPDGEMPTGTRPEMPNGEVPSESALQVQSKNNNSTLQSSSL